MPSKRKLPDEANWFKGAADDDGFFMDDDPTVPMLELPRAGRVKRRVRKAAKLARRANDKKASLVLKVRRPFDFVPGDGFSHGPVVKKGDSRKIGKLVKPFLSAQGLDLVRVDATCKRSAFRELDYLTATVIVEARSSKIP